MPRGPAHFRGRATSPVPCRAVPCPAPELASGGARTARSTNRLPRVGRRGQWAARDPFKVWRRWACGCSVTFESGSALVALVFSVLLLTEGSLINLKMATLIFVDQENGELRAPKTQLKLPSGSSKVLAERTQINAPLPKKGISTSPVASRSVRKALGNVNKTEGVMNKMDKIKQKNQPCIVNKTGFESCHTVAEEDWPEIENMFPLVDPQDFESFDLPEEHKLSNINLCGVPLMVFERTYDRYLLQSTVDFLATLDEIIDMPPPNYDV
ncbi:hypothetical protein IHE44_0003755 [Lamprotornis superbus]|uniref:Securin n=1 Tax=Lamprotornis superbus TaxID=245042 RepID=A0A835NGG8_9PASS|nr:hypothetical protein IHE44_0003755 [Lamprotornis superbus]